MCREFEPSQGGPSFIFMSKTIYLDCLGLTGPKKQTRGNIIQARNFPRAKKEITESNTFEITLKKKCLFIQAGNFTHGFLNFPIVIMSVI